MAEGDYIKFLGTAGARFVVASQLRYSAGTFLSIQGYNVLLDPGPGTLVRCATARPKIDPTKLDAIVLTHAHIDHSNDVNIMIDAMTGGGFKGHGLLFAPGDCLEGENAVVLKYVRGFLDDIVMLKPRSGYRVGDLQFRTSLRHRHSVATYGVKFETRSGIVSFLVDTEFFPELIEGYSDSDILVVNVVRRVPFKHGKVEHLTVEDVKRLISQIRPRRAILTHFGMTMIKARPWEVAGEVARETGVQVEAASDGMKLDLG